MVWSVEYHHDNAGSLVPDGEGIWVSFANQTWAIYHGWVDAASASKQAFFRWDTSNVPAGWTIKSATFGSDPRSGYDAAYTSIYLLTSDYVTLDRTKFLNNPLGTPSTGTDAGEAISTSNISWRIHTFGQDMIDAMNTKLDQTNKMAFCMRYDLQDPNADKDNNTYVNTAAGSLNNKLLLTLNLIPPPNIRLAYDFFFYNEISYGHKTITPIKKDTPENIFA